VGDQKRRGGGGPKTRGASDQIQPAVEEEVGLTGRSRAVTADRGSRKEDGVARSVKKKKKRKNEDHSRVDTGSGCGVSSVPRTLKISC